MWALVNDPDATKICRRKSGPSVYGLSTLHNVSLPLFLYVLIIGDAGPINHTSTIWLSNVDVKGLDAG